MADGRDEGAGAPPSSEGPRSTTNSNRQPKRTREERLLHLYATRPLAVAERAMKQYYGRRQQRSFSAGPPGGGRGGPRGPGGPGGGPRGPR
jgi:hypothetical protein